MSSTTIRVDTETHAALLELSASSGLTLKDTVREAAAALRRQQFALQVASEIDALHADPDAWRAYLRDGSETYVSDGVG